MELFTLKSNRLSVSERRFIIDHLTREGSDFQKALMSGAPLGSIAICLDMGEIVGWARTEQWDGHNTLEAYVQRSYRRRGIARMCAAGLVADNAFDGRRSVAVFDQRMVDLAKCVGLEPLLFGRQPDGSWRPEWV
jgi:ribosomal protein S18 acetylase RimI-like enzyme